MESWANTLVPPSVWTMALAEVEDVQRSNFWGDAKWMRMSERTGEQKVTGVELDQCVSGHVFNA